MPNHLGSYIVVGIGRFKLAFLWLTGEVRFTTCRSYVFCCVFFLIGSRAVQILCERFEHGISPYLVCVYVYIYNIYIYIYIYIDR